jgi:DNA invertase Pin-like site-specific DNA recombinase
VERAGVLWAEAEKSPASGVSAMKVLRCAIYARKSSEEGLDQAFNSLHAQHEACAAFVLSQAGEGWSPIETIYDDGGYSGGSLDRPGIQALLADIGRGLIDIVVVYKVDRLTRSLADFARIVELFDQKGVSFVSITQAFNTTTSMGRLTLNVLLSFAQFEREVTGERIRDKIAASKQKGLWMGGRPPLGYDGVDLKLVVNEAEGGDSNDHKQKRRQHGFEDSDESQELQGSEVGRGFGLGPGQAQGSQVEVWHLGRRASARRLAVTLDRGIGQRIMKGPPRRRCPRSGRAYSERIDSSL